MGATLVAAWAGSAGVAQATGGDSAPEPGCEAPVALTSTDDGETPFPENCSADVWVEVDGDCEDPETFTFSLEAEGLVPGEKYIVAFDSDDLSYDDSEFPGLFHEFTADEDGAAWEEFTETEGDFEAPSDGFVLDYAVLTGHDTDHPVVVGGGSYEVEACEAIGPPVTPQQPATPVTPVTTPAATPSVAPVVVQPVASHPVVLANTGSPVATAALLGGGLLVAGAGALVATRRRSS